jgi:uncharacterized Rossmann fold enzyme
MRFHFVSRAENEGNMTPHEEANANVPLVEATDSHSRKLAIVGGGPSVQNKLAKLRKWKGDIWAINATTSYLARKGIRNTLVSVDPCVLELEDYEAHKGAQSAILGACCDPKLFELYVWRVRAFYTRPNPRAPFIAGGGTTTATRLPLVAHALGYQEITFFGCEGSYLDESHVGTDKRADKRLYILAGGVRYCTEPYMMVQGQWLADLISKFPAHCHEESGGLLRAMIKHPDWTVLGVSDAMKTHLEDSRQQFQEKIRIAA